MSRIGRSPATAAGRPGRRRMWFAGALALAPAAAVLAAAGGAAPAAAQATTPAPSCSGATCTVTFPETGALATWDVPAGITSAAITLYGAGGGAAGDSAGGAGAEVTGTVALANVTSLTVNVGGAGEPAGFYPDGGPGGYGGGGASGYGGFAGAGGGATTLSDSDGTLLVAGGGGGGGNALAGGNGGNADTAGSAARSSSDGPGGAGGGAGTQTAGGAGGAGGASQDCSNGETGPAGTAGQGGGGDNNGAGGAGGGGYFGGGQGGGGGICLQSDGSITIGGAGGGGGGSSYTGGSGVSGAAVNDSPNAPAGVDGNGEAVISYSYGAQVITFTSTPPSPAVVGGSYTPAATGGGSGNPVTFSIDASSTAGACSISSGTVSFTAAGTCTADASQAAGNGYAAGTAQQVITIDQAPAFTVDSPPATATAGQSYSYTFVASGTPAPTYALAAGAPSWLSVDASTGTVSGTVPAGTTSFSYAVTAANAAGTATAGPFTVTVTAASVKADLAAGLSCPASLTAGGTGTCTLTVTNHGPAAASKVIAAVALPASLAETACSSGCTRHANVITWTASSLADGAAATYTVTVKAAAAGKALVLGAAVSASPDPDPLNNIALATITISK